MTRDGSARTSYAALRLLLAVTALVAGLLGMHALAVHGTGASSETAGMAGMPGMAAHASDHGDDVPAGGHDPGGMGAMAGMCLAVLLAAAAALVALVLHRRPRGSWLLARARPSWRPTRLPPRAGTGPPVVWEFSVLRC